MKISIGIASTTHVDRHRHRMEKSALESMAEQIRARYIPHLIEHDFNRQIGILLEARVLQMDDLEFGLYVVFGDFENDEERSMYSIGSSNTVWHRYSNYLDGVPTAVAGNDLKISKDEGVELTVADLLERHLDSTGIWFNGEVYFTKNFIASINDLVIHVWPKDHAPAHFHVISKQKNLDAKFDINTLDFISSKGEKITKSQIKKIKHFFEFNPDALKKLRDTYNRLQ